MVIDAKKAHLRAMAGRELFIELPPEAGGGCARLRRSCTELATLLRSGRRAWRPSCKTLDLCEAGPIPACLPTHGVALRVLRMVTTLSSLGSPTS